MRDINGNTITESKAGFCAMCGDAEEPWEELHTIRELGKPLEIHICPVCYMALAANR